MDLREEIQSYIIDLLTEGVETKNMKLAKHYLYDKYGYNEQTALKVIGNVKSEIPNSRLGKCKFMLGLVRMLMNGEFNDASNVMNINKCLKYIASDAHINEYDNDLNGLNCKGIIQRFGGVAKIELQNDMDDIFSQQYSRNNNYRIVKIKSFEGSEEFGDYVDWCVTYDQRMYDSYTNGGNGVFYFCLRNGYEDEEDVVGENCPLDSYGLSMIAVSVNDDGSCNTITCRWNHDNGGNDHIMTTKQLSELLGVNFYEVFKPLTPEEIEENRNRVLYTIEGELVSLMGYETPDDYCDLIIESDPENGDKDERTAYVYNSEECNGVVLVDYNWNLLCNQVFDSINYRRADIFEVEKNDKANFLTIDGKLISDTWFSSVDNCFDYGFGIVSMGADSNVIKLDGTFLFENWYRNIRPINKFSALTLYNNDNRSYMISDFDGNFLLDSWYDKIFYAGEDNVFIRFVGEQNYRLYDGKTYKQKAPYEVLKLLGYYYQKYYRVQLASDGKDYLMGDDGSLYDVDTRELVFNNGGGENPKAF